MPLRQRKHCVFNFLGCLSAAFVRLFVQTDIVTMISHERLDWAILMKLTGNINSSLLMA